MRIILPAAAIVTALSLGGCSDCSRDPSQVGLGCATVNLVGGVYEEDDAAIRREIAALEARRDALRDEADRLSAEASRLSGERRAAADRLARLNRETADMNARLERLSRRDDVSPARAAELRDREESLSRQVLAADPDSSSAEIARLEAEKAALLASIDQILAAS